MSMWMMYNHLMHSQTFLSSVLISGILLVSGGFVYGRIMSKK
ncbi:hypothetical protein ABIC37_002691 [Priestia megaterium]|nr:hypothetical protein EV581_103391 [Bacillus sp. BK006]